MTMSFQSRLRADVRLAMLQLLAKDLGQSLNHEIMRDAVESATAHSLTEAEVREHFAWLEDRGAVTTEAVGRFTIATLTDAGMKLVQGKDRVEGIRVPSAEERKAFI